MFQGYKTVVFNVIMAVIAMVHAFSPGSDLPGAEAVNSGVDAFLAGIAGVWGIGAIILRAITSSPIFKKKEPTT